MGAWHPDSREGDTGSGARLCESVCLRTPPIAFPEAVFNPRYH